MTTQTITKEAKARFSPEFSAAINKLRDFRAVLIEVMKRVKGLEAAYFGLTLKKPEREYLPDCATCGKPSTYELMDGVNSRGFYCAVHLSAAIAAHGEKRYADAAKAEALLTVVGIVERAVAKIVKAREPITLIDPTLSIEASQEEVTQVMQQIEAMRQARRDAGDPDVDLYRRPKGNGHKR